MAGTNSERTLIAEGPAIILVHPQLGENIGMVARAMANFGLAELRLVNPRDGWPSEKAISAASKADHVIEAAKVYPSLEEAVSDLEFVYATTARDRYGYKEVRSPVVAADDLRTRFRAGQKTGILFGRERTGLTNEEIALADELVTFPVNPAFASLNLAQAVLLNGYEWFKTTSGEPPFRENNPSPPAKREMILSMFDYLEGELDLCGFFPPGKKPIMTANLRDILHRLDMTEQEARTLRGVFKSLVEGPKKARLLARQAEAPEQPDE